MLLDERRNRLEQLMSCSVFHTRPTDSEQREAAKDLLRYFTSIVNAMFAWPDPQKTEHGIRYVPVFLGVKVTSTDLPGATTVWPMPRALD